MLQSKDTQENIVKIKKLKVNFELRYNYLKMLSEYIKRFPKEHRKTRKDNIIDSEGNKKDDWVRTVSDAKIGDVISFMLDNKIRFVFENITNDELNRLRSEYLERQKKIADVLKLKAEQLDVSNEDYSFMKIEPYEYQKKAIKFFEINDGIAILGDQPGVGKTCPAFAYAVKYKLKTLVICPSSLKLMWRNEILKFTNEKAFVYKLNPPKNSKTIPYTKEESLFHITNYESIQTYIKLEYKHKCNGKIIKQDGSQKKCEWEILDINKNYKKCPICKNVGSVKSKIKNLVAFDDNFGHDINPDDYDLIIIDECHRIKETKTTWTKIIHKAFGNIPKKILMSGTVIKNRPIEFFSSLSFINPKEWKNSHEFGVQYGAGYQTNYGWDYDGASNLEELFTRVSPFFLRRLKKDVLKELPPKTFLEIPIELSDKERADYKKLEKEMRKVIVNGVEMEKDETYLAKIHKLKMFTGRIKMEKVKDIVNDIIDAGEKVVIVSDYIELCKGIKEYFGDICVIHNGEMNDMEKQASVENFQNDKKIKVFSGMIIASGVGITLTSANKLIKIGFSWSPSDEEQVEDRIHRANTKHDNIEILKLICQDTIDEDIDELLNDKSHVVTKTLDNMEFKKEKHRVDENIFKSLVEKIKEREKNN